MRVTASIKCTIVVEFDDDGVNDHRDQAFDTLHAALGMNADVEIASSDPAVIEEIKE